MADFLRSLDQVRVQSGVEFQSIVPNPPTAQGGIAATSLGITVQGSYAQVRSYADRLEALPRLVVVDNVSMNAGAAAEGAAASTGSPTGEVFAGAGAAPVISMQLTARVFTSQVPAAEAGGAGAQTATAPAAAAPGTPQNN
jgi:Tfp pilus assembly protein PilO